jgi:hypothetical protein
VIETRDEDGRTKNLSNRPMGSIIRDEGVDFHGGP